MGRGYFHTFELSRSPSAHSWALPHARAFSLATLARGYFHTFELSRSPSAPFVGTSTRSSFLTRCARSWVLLHVRAFLFAFGSLCRHFHTLELSRSSLAHFVGTFTRSSFLVRLWLTL